MRCAHRITGFAITMLLVIPISLYGQSEHEELVLDQEVAPHKELDALYHRFSQAYRTLDAALVASIYAEHARYLSPGADIRQGRAAIHKSFESSFRSTQERGERREIAFRIVERQVSGGLAYDVGVYTLISYDKEGTSRVHLGKFIVIARREKDGAWHFQVDGYSDIKTDNK